MRSPGSAPPPCWAGPVLPGPVIDHDYVCPDSVLPILCCPICDARFCAARFVLTDYWRRRGTRSARRLPGPAGRARVVRVPGVAAGDGLAPRTAVSRRAGSAGERDHGSSPSKSARDPSRAARARPRLRLDNGPAGTNVSRTRGWARRPPKGDTRTASVKRPDGTSARPSRTSRETRRTDETPRDQARGQPAAAIPKLIMHSGAGLVRRLGAGRPGRRQTRRAPEYMAARASSKGSAGTRAAAAPVPDCHRLHGVSRTAAVAVSGGHVEVAPAMSRQDTGSMGSVSSRLARERQADGRAPGIPPVHGRPAEGARQVRVLLGGQRTRLNSALRRSG